MALLKLNCVNCSAPLEIGDDLERFACAYCGTTQIVEHAGGVVALRRVESAIQAVQKGTEKTAAELALPRLEKELAAAQESLNQATARLQEKIGRARSGRRLLTAILATVIFMAGMMTVGIAASASETMSYIHVAVWMTALVVIPTFVYRKIKLPQSSRSEVEGAEAKIAKIRGQIDAARAVVDSVH